MTEQQIKSVGEYMVHLKARWLDEKKYENFKDYATALAMRLPTEVKLVKLNKNFLAVIETNKGVTGTIKATVRGYTWTTNLENK